MSSLVFTKAASPGLKLRRRVLKFIHAAEAAKKADIIMILINDEKQAALTKE